jgi:hypothetical protein
MYRPNLAFLAHSDRNFSVQAPQAHGGGFHTAVNNPSSASSSSSFSSGLGGAGASAVGRSCLERMADVVEYLQNEKRNQTVRLNLLYSLSCFQCDRCVCVNKGNSHRSRCRDSSLLAGTRHSRSSDVCVVILWILVFYLLHYTYFKIKRVVLLNLYIYIYKL